ncbi:MAG: hypothetical protein IJP33_03590, partial [Firmicutes bacterium]|nr:hypothetical protein [Bacillota bacterium]
MLYGYKQNLFGQQKNKEIPSHFQMGGVLFSEHINMKTPRYFLQVSGEFLLKLRGASPFHPNYIKCYNAEAKLLPHCCSLDIS